MLLKEFPDIKFVQTLANKKTELQRKHLSVDLRKDGWQNVILNFKSGDAERKEIRGPLSIFMNIRGKSNCIVDDRILSIREEHFFLMNEDQYFNLEIDKKDNTEIFNIHFGEQFSRDLLVSMTNSDLILLDEPNKSMTTLPKFYCQLYKKSEVLNQLIHNYQKSQLIDTLSIETEEYFLARILELLLQENDEIIELQKNVPVVKKYVKEEIFKRLNIAKDYMISNFNQNFDLETVCKVAHFSKFHFLRLFKQIYGITPQNFIINIRLNYAKKLLMNSNHSLQDIAELIGYENHASLSRIFKKQLLISPSQYRKNSNIG